MKTRLAISAVILGAVVAGVFAIALRHPAGAPTAPPSRSEAARANPITIPAMRARSYPGHDLTTQQALGDQGGYKNFITSYQSDGLKVYELMSVPDGNRPSGGWPVVILDHGYINPSQYQTDGSGYRDIIAALARAGFVVVKPDYRGNGRSQGQPEGGHFSPVYAYDTLNLIAAFKRYQPINPRRIGLLGHSMGGHEALRTIVVSPDVKATVFMAGVVGSFNDIFYHWPNNPVTTDQPIALTQSRRQALINQYGTPESDPEFWNSASAINYVSHVTGAVQIDQDAGDSVVPKLFSDHLDAALQAAHKPAQYYVYPGDDHQFAQNRKLFLQRVIAFYQANL